MPVGTLWTAMALALGAVGGSGLGSGVVAQAASARLARNVIVFMAPSGDGFEAVIASVFVSSCQHTQRLPTAVKVSYSPTLEK
jgi:hypothetical protein